MASPRTQARQTESETSGAEPMLRLVRVFAAPRETVFRAWTDPKALVEWWGPKGYTVPLCEMDVRPGGAWRTCMRSPEGDDYCVQGTYREITEPEKLVFTWAWETDGAPGHETLVTVEFRDRHGSTELVLTQARFESVESRDQHSQGWSSSFDCLDEILSGD